MSDPSIYHRGCFNLRLKCVQYWIQTLFIAYQILGHTERRWQIGFMNSTRPSPHRHAAQIKLQRDDFENFLQRVRFNSFDW